MTSLALSVPVVGQPHSTEDPKVGNSLTAVQVWANGSIDGVNVVASLTGRRMVGQTFAFVPAATATGSYFVNADGTLVASGSNSTKAANWWYLDPSIWAIVGKTNTQMILRIAAATNGVAPGVSCAVGAQVNSVTFGGATGNIVSTFGTLQAAGGFGTNGLSSGSAAVAESTIVAVPSAGACAPLVTISGAATAANSAISLNLQLFVLNS